jgi:hypothetical protein
LETPGRRNIHFRERIEEYTGRRADCRRFFVGGSGGDFVDLFNFDFDFPFFPLLSISDSNEFVRH